MWRIAHDLKRWELAGAENTQSKALFVKRLCDASAPGSPRRAVCPTQRLRLTLLARINCRGSGSFDGSSKSRAVV